MCGIRIVQQHEICINKGSHYIVRDNLFAAIFSFTSFLEWNGILRAGFRLLILDHSVNGWHGTLVQGFSKIFNNTNLFFALSRLRPLRRRRRNEETFEIVPLFSPFFRKASNTYATENGHLFFFSLSIRSSHSIQFILFSIFAQSHECAQWWIELCALWLCHVAVRWLSWRESVHHANEFAKILHSFAKRRWNCVVFATNVPLEIRIWYLV